MDVSLNIQMLLHLFLGSISLINSLLTDYDNILRVMPGPHGHRNISFHCLTKYTTIIFLKTLDNARLRERQRGNMVTKYNHLNICYCHSLHGILQRLLSQRSLYRYERQQYLCLSTRTHSRCLGLFLFICLQIAMCTEETPRAEPNLS